MSLGKKSIDDIVEGLNRVWDTNMADLEAAVSEVKKYAALNKREITENMQELKVITQAMLDVDNYTAALPLMLARAHLEQRNPAAQYNVGAVWYKQALLDGDGTRLRYAQTQFLAAHKLDAKNKRYLYAYLTCSNRLEDYNAVMDIADGIEPKLLSADIFTLIGIAHLYGRENTGSAEAYFGRAKDLQPDNLLHLVNIAETYAARADAQNAYTLLEEVQSRYYLLVEDEPLKAVAVRGKIKESLEVGIAHGSYDGVKDESWFNDLKTLFSVESSGLRHKDVLTQGEIDELLKAAEQIAS